MREGGQNSGSYEAVEDAQLVELETSLQRAFRDPSLLLQALTHGSFCNEHAHLGLANNERLEFLGDAVLELAVSHILYRAYPSLPEGELSRLRSRLVSSRNLARVARQRGLGRYLRLGVGEERTGGRKRPSNLANALEATVGAVFLDGGFSAAHEFVDHLFAEQIRSIGPEPPKDAKSALQEWAQQRYHATPQYQIVGVHGPQHAARFEAEVVVDHVRARGEGGSKKEAQQSAAGEALKLLQRRRSAEAPGAAGDEGSPGVADETGVDSESGKR